MVVKSRIIPRRWFKADKLQVVENNFTTFYLCAFFGLLHKFKCSSNARIWNILNTRKMFSIFVSLLQFPHLRCLHVISQPAWGEHSNSVSRIYTYINA